MSAFEPRYVEARALAEVRRVLRPGGVLLAGGTDLVPLMEDGLVEPRQLVDIRRARGAAAIRTGPRGAWVGAVATLADIAADRGVGRYFPALAKACLAVGTAQIRNVATLGGNLCQRPRCWYFRQRVPCYKNGGRTCPAVAGLNEYLAILGGGPCYAVHGSDPAVALGALDARIVVLRATGRRVRYFLDEFFTPAARRLDGETVLGRGDVIERVEIPRRFAGGKQVFLKATQRQAWDFALVSVAAAWRKGQGGVRLALGGVAPQPWVLDVLPGAGLRWAEAVADAALGDAAPLSQNAYKVTLARNLICEALGGSVRR